MVDVLGDAYTLGDGARSILQKALTSCYASGMPTIKDVIASVESIPDKDRVRGWKTSAIRALETLSFVGAADVQDQEKMVRSLLQRCTILELDSLAGHANIGGRPDGWIGTAPVGTLCPNDFGLHDMHGNVAEPIADHAGTYCGGSFRGGATMSTVEYRVLMDPDQHVDILGVRAARRVHRP